MCNVKKEVLSITLLFCFLVSIFTNSVYAVGDSESAVFDSSDQMLHTPEQLVLSSEDVPEVINFSDAQEKGHILRLREKEPDDKFDRAYELNIRKTHGLPTLPMLLCLYTKMKANIFNNPREKEDILK